MRCIHFIAEDKFLPLFLKKDTQFFQLRLCLEDTTNFAWKKICVGYLNHDLHMLSVPTFLSLFIINVNFTYILYVAWNAFVFVAQNFYESTHSSFVIHLSYWYRISKSFSDIGITCYIFEKAASLIICSHSQASNQHDQYFRTTLPRFGVFFWWKK